VVGSGGAADGGKGRTGEDKSRAITAGFHSYSRSALSFEVCLLSPHSHLANDIRPEAIESVFILYRITGDEYWYQAGWDMFQAIQSHTKLPIAHSAIDDVTNFAPSKSNEMESFWLAETLKYFYLLFSEPSVISLDEYVL
jgi:hypothetical protein